MTGKFSDLSTAAKMRDLITRISSQVVNLIHPPPRFGRVIEFNRFTHFAKVQLIGDTAPIRVTMSRNMQPNQSATNNIENDVTKGDFVRIGGKAPDYYIEDVVRGNAFMDSPNMYHPRFYTGSFFHVPTLKYDSFQADLPAVGSTYHIGRWDNSSSFAADGTGFIEIEVQHTFFTSQTKRYQVPVHLMHTGEGIWQKIAPAWDSGPYNDNEFGMEILVDGTGFQLRIRRITTSAGPSPGGYDVRLQIWMDDVYYQIGSAEGEAVTTEPTRFIGTVDKIRDKGPFMGPMMAIPRLLQTTLTGGGSVTWSGTHLSWSEPFYALGVGKGYQAKDGFFSMNKPVTSTVIPVYGNTGQTTATVTAAGVPLVGAQALFYIPPYGDFLDSLAAQYVILDAVDGEFSTPSHWILIAQRASITGSASLLLGTGEQLDHWRNFSFSNGWTDFAAGWQTCQYRVMDGRWVKLHGLAVQATGANVNATITTLPAGYRPALDHIFNVRWGAGATTSAQRLNITAAGVVTLANAPTTSNTWASFADVMFALP